MAPPPSSKRSNADAAMFRNKVLVRAALSAPPPPFLLRQVSFPAAVPALDLDILCWRLSRCHRLSCLPQPPSDILVVYQRCQSCAAAEVVSVIAAAFEGATVGEEEEVVCSGSLVAKAVECGLRSLMLEHGWRCLGETVYVHSTFAAIEERTDLCAVNVEIKLGRNDDIEFVVSPDALRFTTHKFFELVSSDKMETFENGKEVILGDYNFQTACTTLPTLQEGHVKGFSKILPTGQCLDKFVQFCSLKHGLEAGYSYHAAIRFGYESSLEIWLPCSFVLQGPGLQPAPKSSRASRAMSALQSFMGLLNGWNFFGQNQLIIKEQLLLNSTATLPTWDKAISNARTNNYEDPGLVRTNFVMNDQSLTLDFRTPKPAALCSTSVKPWNTKSQVTTLSFDDDGTENGKGSINYDCQTQPIVRTNLYKSQLTLLKPSFSRNKSEGGYKRKHSSEHSDADNLDKLRHISLTNSALVSRSHEKKCAESPVRNCQKVTLKVRLQDYSQKENLDASRKIQKPCNSMWSLGGSPSLLLQLVSNSKDYIPQVPDETRAMPGVKNVKNDMLSTKVMKPAPKCVVSSDEKTAPKKKTKQKVHKDELTAVTKPTIKIEDINDQFTKKVVGHQKDEVAKKVTKGKARAVVNGIELTSMSSKANSDVSNDDIVRKVTDHHKRGELRLLTVADLKCFLSARKVKVGGTKEVLINRAAELLR